MAETRRTLIYFFFNKKESFLTTNLIIRMERFRACKRLQFLCSKKKKRYTKMLNSLMTIFIALNPPSSPPPNYQPASPSSFASNEHISARARQLENFSHRAQRHMPAYYTSHYSAFDLCPITARTTGLKNRARAHTPALSTSSHANYYHPPGSSLFSTQPNEGSGRKALARAGERTMPRYYYFAERACEEALNHLFLSDRQSREGYTCTRCSLPSSSTTAAAAALHLFSRAMRSLSALVYLI